MKVIRISIVYLFFSFVILQYACEQEGTPGFNESPSEVFDFTIKDSVLVNEVFVISLKHYGSNGCAQHSRTTKRLVDSTLNLVVYEKVDQSKVCTQVIKTISSSYNYSFSSKGKKFIRFNESNQLIDSLYVK